MQFSFHLQYFLRGANIEKIFLLKRLIVNILKKRGMLNTLSLIKEGFPVVGVITTGVRKIKKEVILSLFLLNQGHHHTSVRSLLISIFPGCRQTVVS